MVLERPDHPAMLCLGGILTSLPPQCGDTPITNWSWDRVEGEERQVGVTWGEYHVVGTYDGASFTVLDVGPKRPAEAPNDDIEILCQEPVGGWVSADPSRTSESDLEAASRLVAGQPDSSGFWIKHTETPPTDQAPHGPNDIVVNAAFTGDIDRHRADLSQVWGGPLCVVRYERTEAELRRIQSELTDHGRSDFGLQVLWSDSDVVHNHVEIGVVVADDGARAAVDARYGEGTVHLLPALHPVG